MKPKYQKGNIFNYVLLIVALLLAILWIASTLPQAFENIKTTYEENPLSQPIRALSENKFFPIQIEDENGITNVLLLGISGRDYISGYLTDTIILASINTPDNRISFFSIPRDLWVSTSAHEWQKINELYQLDGGTETPEIEATNLIREKIVEISGQPIHYTALINLRGVQQIVDILGGVDTEAGRLNGEEALDYIRDRSTVGGDFDRMIRQQKLLLAFRQEIERYDESENMTYLLSLYETVQQYVATDSAITELLRFYEIARKIPPENISLFAITSGEKNLLYSDYTNIAGQDIYTLHPNAGDEDYSEIQEFIKAQIANGK